MTNNQKNTDIDQLSKRYALGGIVMAILLFAVGFALMKIMDWPVLAPLIISAVYVMVADCVEALVWRRIAKKSASGLTTFYSAASAFRLLVALAIMFVYYLINGREAMLPFFLVFMTFYVAQLLHHTIFFARTRTHSSVQPNNNE